jgi:N-acetylmuramoyl-L-alanine amidase
MYPFTQDLSARQKNVSKWTNICEYIVLHDTGVIWNGNIPILLGENGSRVSCHFLIRQDWTTYKLWDPKQILWHCWESMWEGKTNLNRYAVGIEVEWPWFTKVQRVKLRELTRHLMAVLNIPKDRVIRHRDIAPWRKFDPRDSLFWLSGFKLWRMILTPKEVW